MICRLLRNVSRTLFHSKPASHEKSIRQRVLVLPSYQDILGRTDSRPCETIGEPELPNVSTKGNKTLQGLHHKININHAEETLPSPCAYTPSSQQIVALAPATIPSTLRSTIPDIRAPTAPPSHVPANAESQQTVTPSPMRLTQGSTAIVRPSHV